MTQQDKDALIAAAEAQGVTIDKRWSASRIQEELDKQPSPAEVAAAANTSGSQPAGGTPPVQSEAGGDLDLSNAHTAGDKLVTAAGQVGPSQGFALTAEAIIATLEGAPYELLARLESAIDDAKRRGPKPGAPSAAEVLADEAGVIQTINQDATAELSPAAAAGLAGVPEVEYTSHVVKQRQLQSGQFTGPQYLVVYDQSSKHFVKLD